MSAQSETAILELLRQRYERDGYSFILRPDPSTLPQFMSGYQPDAVARKGDISIAIEIKSRLGATTTSRLRELAARFKQQPDWRLHVVNAGEIEPEALATPNRDEVLARLAAIETIAANDNHDAALVLAWGALEAAARVIAQEAGEAPPKSPNEALQLLEYLGRMDYQTAQAMRHALDLRNQVVHGDFTAAVPLAAVTELVLAVRTALAA
jgi:hypothetical protein